MRMADTPDPSAFFRQMLGQWEQFADSVGGDTLKSGKFARTMHGAAAATIQAQEAVKRGDGTIARRRQHA